MEGRGRAGVLDGNILCGSFGVTQVWFQISAYRLHDFRQVPSPTPTVKWALATPTLGAAGVAGDRDADHRASQSRGRGLPTGAPQP